MKRKIVILTVTALMTISMVGCMSQKNKEMQDTMNNVSDTLNKIDSNFNKKTLTYKDSQKLIENISSQLSEFKPEVTPDKQTIILNLATREISGEIGREYIMINMVANKTDYTIQVSGNIFRDKYGKVPKNDATVRALYDLLIDTNSISGLNINEYIEMLNDQSLAKNKIKETIRNFNEIDFNYYEKNIVFEMTKTLNRNEEKINKIEVSQNEFKEQRLELKNKLSDYSKEFAKINNLKCVEYKNKDINKNLTTFGVLGDGFSAYIDVNLETKISSSKSASNICKFSMGSDQIDPKLKQLHRDYLVGAIRIINSITNSDINYGEIKDVIDSNETRSKYSLKNTNLQTVFKYSNNLEKSLIDDIYTYNQTIKLK